MRRRRRQSHPLEQGPLQRAGGPEVLRLEALIIGVATQVLCSKRHEAIQGKALHHHVEDIEAFIGIKPAIVPNGECNPCRERRGKQGRRVVRLGVDIGHGPSKDVYVIIFTVDIYALQRYGVLRSMGVLCDVGKKFLHFATVRETGGECCETQPCEGW